MSDERIAGRPQNVVVYATSNRRHLLSRDMLENERSTAIRASEAAELERRALQFAQHLMASG